MLKSVTFWKLVCGLLSLYCTRIDPTGFIIVNVIVYYLLLNHRYEAGVAKDTVALSARVAPATTDDDSRAERESDGGNAEGEGLPKVRNHRKNASKDQPTPMDPITGDCKNPTGRNCPTPANHPPAWQANRLQRILYDEMNRPR